MITPETRNFVMLIVSTLWLAASGVWVAATPFSAGMDVALPILSLFGATFMWNYWMGKCTRL